jgi:hypothetical protein
MELFSAGGETEIAEEGWVNKSESPGASWLLLEVEGVGYLFCTPGRRSTEATGCRASEVSPSRPMSSLGVPWRPLVPCDPSLVPSCLPDLL